MKNKEYWVYALGARGKRAFVPGPTGQNYHEAYHRAAKACFENEWVLRVLIFSDKSAIVIKRERLLDNFDREDV